MEREELTAAILAGGKSSRLGSDKALAEVGSRPMLNRAIAAVEPLAKEILVVGRMELNFPAGNAQCIPDIQPGLGPVGGLASALAVASHDRVLCIGCDMPFLNTGLLRLLVHSSPHADVTILRVGGKVEPLCAIYHRRIQPIVLRLIREGQLRMREMFGILKTAYCDVGSECENMLFNVNTPDDLDLAKRLAQMKNEQPYGQQKQAETP